MTTIPSSLPLLFLSVGNFTQTEVRRTIELSWLCVIRHVYER